MIESVITAMAVAWLVGSLLVWFDKESELRRYERRNNAWREYEKTQPRKPFGLYPRCGDPPDGWPPGWKGRR